MTCRDILAIAQQCLAMRPEEAADRAAISRAYYAAFSRASDYCGSFPRPEGSHEEVIKAVRELDFNDSYHHAQELAQLKKLRVKADYKRNDIIDRRDAELAVDDAGLLIQWFDRLPHRRD